MAIKEEGLRELIRDTLTPLGLYSEDVEELLILTAATESNLGEHLSQVGGPAMGIYMIEPSTAQDIHNNYLHYREDTANKVYALMTMVGEDLKYNLQYQTIMARLHYKRIKEPLPDKEDIEAMAEYWKSYFNTNKGKGTVTKAMEKYNYYVGKD